MFPFIVKSEIEVARKEVEDKVEPLEYKQLEYKRYGKKYLKEQQFSPDAVAQVAFQVSLDNYQDACENRIYTVYY